MHPMPPRVALQIPGKQLYGRIQSARFKYMCDLPHPAFANEFHGSTKDRYESVLLRESKIKIKRTDLDIMLARER